MRGSSKSPPALLCYIGCITILLDILNKVSKGKSLTDKERAIYESHPDAADSCWLTFHGWNLRRGLLRVDDDSDGMYSSD